MGFDSPDSCVHVCRRSMHKNAYKHKRGLQALFSHMHTYIAYVMEESVRF